MDSSNFFCFTGRSSENFFWRPPSNCFSGLVDFTVSLVLYLDTEIIVDFSNFDSWTINHFMTDLGTYLTISKNLGFEDSSIEFLGLRLTTFFLPFLLEWTDEVELEPDLLSRKSAKSHNLFVISTKFCFFLSSIETFCNCLCFVSSTPKLFSFSILMKCGFTYKPECYWVTWIRNCKNLPLS